MKNTQTVILIFLLGLVFGSFINALVWRLHKQLTSKKKSDKHSISRGRSMCPNCLHMLHARDLIPVMSWVLLKGRCRYCKKPISSQYPVVEILVSALFVWSYFQWPAEITGIVIAQFGLWLGLLVILSALVVYDFKYMLLPNKLVASAGIITFIWILINALFGTHSAKPIIDSLFGLLSFGGLFYILFQISNGKWIGGGDVKLGFVLGAWLANPLLSFLAIFAGSVFGLLLTPILTHSKKLSMQTRIPFGPMLIMGTIVATLYGSKLVNMYNQFTIGL